MTITMIAMTDINLGISDEKGNLLFSLPRDMAMFKSVTSGKHVVMGRKTWDSIGGQPLPKRKNYVLTKDDSFEIQGKTKVLNSVEEVVEMSKTKDVYIIGGGEIYKQFLPLADKLILTHVHAYGENPTTFFPDYSVRDWKITKVIENKPDSKHKYSFTFATYIRNK